MNDFKSLVSKMKKDARVKECFCDNFQCTGRIIQAHSIQNNRILNRISEDGLVVKLEGADENGNFIINTEEIGRKIATVSTNFCGFHDDLIFKPIESKDYQKHTRNQEFLFAYRAFAKEYHVKLEVRNFQRNAMDMSTGLRKNDWKYSLTGTEIALEQLEREKLILNTSLEECRFEILKTYIIEFHGHYDVAASSLFSIKHDLYGNQINDIQNLKKDLKHTFLSVFPQGNRTFVLISFYRKDQSYFSFFNDQIMKKSIAEKKVIISNLILYHVENFVISPKLWRNLSQENKDTIRQVFLKTVNSFENRLSHLADINLFV